MKNGTLRYTDFCCAQLAGLSKRFKGVAIFFRYSPNVGSKGAPHPVVFGGFFTAAIHPQMTFVSLVGEGNNDGLMAPLIVCSNEGL